jgi:hypothetical protein
VNQSLRRQGLCAKAAKTFKATTHSNHTLPVAENLMKQNFTAQRPNQVWVGDITYIGTDEGWLDLAVVLDLFSQGDRLVDVRAHHGDAGMRCAADGPVSASGRVRSSCTPTGAASIVRRTIARCLMRAA